MLTKPAAVGSLLQDKPGSQLLQRNCRRCDDDIRQMPTISLAKLSLAVNSPPELLLAVKSFLFALHCLLTLKLCNPDLWNP